MPDRSAVARAFALALCATFILSGVRLAAADQQDYLSYTIITELGIRVVDNETGARINNVIIEGEVHSATLHFSMTINGNCYTYEIFDANFKTLDSGCGVLKAGRFVLPVSRWLEPGSHTYQMTAYAENYADKQVSGSFCVGEALTVRIEMERGTSSRGTFTLEVSPTSGTVLREWREGGTRTVEQNTVKVTYSTYEQTGTAAQSVLAGYWVDVQCYKQTGTNVVWGWVSADFSTYRSYSGTKAADPVYGGWEEVSASIYNGYSGPKTTSVRTLGEYRYVSSWGPCDRDDLYDSWPTGPRYSGDYRTDYYKYTTGWWPFNGHWVGYNMYRWATWTETHYLARPITGYNYKIYTTTSSGPVYGWVSTGRSYVSASQYYSPPSGTRYSNPVADYQTQMVPTYGWVSHTATVTPEEAARYRSAYSGNGGYRETQFTVTTTETVPSEWVSRAREVTIVSLTPSAGFDGTVELSVEAPAGIEWELAPAPDVGDVSVEVVGEAGAAMESVTIVGTINSSSVMRVYLSNPKPVQFTLKVEAPEVRGERSNDSVAGNHTIVVRASGCGVARENRFALNVRSAPSGYAIVVGIDDYSSESGCRDLYCAVSSAEDWRDYLRGKGYEISAFLTDANATEVNIKSAVQNLAHTHPEDNIAFVFFGHGSYNWLCCYDFGYYLGTDIVSQGGIKDDQLEEMFSSFGGKLFIFLHACYSGSMEQVINDSPHKANRYMVTACGADNETWDSKHWSNCFLDELIGQSGHEDVEGNFTCARAKYINKLNGLRWCYTEAKLPLALDGDPNNPFYL